MNISLVTGRQVSVDQIYQWRTYGGLLAGKPDEYLNNAHIEDAGNTARRYGPVDCDPYIIMPSPETIAARLPAITCVAVFSSGPLERADSEPYTSLAVVWFQNEFAFPIAQKIEEQICTIDWEHCAKDWLE